MSDILLQLQTWQQIGGQWIGESPWGFPAVGAVVALVLLWMMLRLTYGGDKSPTGNTNILDEDAEPGVFGSFTEGLAAQIPESETEADEFSQMLRQAGLYSPTARASIYATRFVLLFIPLLVAGICMAIYPWEYTLRILIIGGVVAAFFSILPRFYVYMVRNARQQEIREGLADMMDMLSMCMSGGLPLTEGLDHVAKNLTNYPALSDELQILKRQAEVGSLKHALGDFAKRVDLAEVRQLTSMLARGDQLGGRLTHNLIEQADHFRETRRQGATEQANQAPVKMVLPLMLCFAPAALIMLISPAMLELREFINPQEGRENVLSGNEMTAQGVARSIQGLDQSAGNGAIPPTDPNRVTPPRRRPQYAGDNPGNNPPPGARAPAPGAAPAGGTTPQPPALQGPPPTGGLRPRRPVGGGS